MGTDVAVLIPSYSHATYLEACLSSLSAQTFSDWQAILIDDCSPDDSLEIAKAYQTREPRLTVLSNDCNRGTYATLQRALDKTDAPFVAILNSDDIWLPEKLEHQLSQLKRHSDLVASYTHGKRIGPLGEDLPSDDLHSDWPTDPKQNLLPYLLRENRVIASSVVFRRDGLRFHPECRYSGDWVALLERCTQGPIGYLSDPLTSWRIHRHNNHQRSPGQLDEEIWIRESIHRTKWTGQKTRNKEIKEGLARNEMHLAALYVLSGSMSHARLAALRGLSLKPSGAGAKRLAATTMPKAQAQKRLWPAEEPVTQTASGRQPLVWFI